MLVGELLAKTNWPSKSNQECLKNEIDGVIVGDLLSYIMAMGHEKQVWVTIQGHLNVVAVAALKEFSCIIICDGSPLDPDVIEKANQEKIAIIQCELSQFEVCKVLINEGY